MTTIKGTLQPLRNTVFVRDLENGARKSAGGIFILDDDMKDSGIRSRWAEVYAVGPEITDIQPGEWILVKHGRWTFGMDLEHPTEGIIKIWRVDYPDAVDVVSPIFPSELKPINQ